MRCTLMTVKNAIENTKTALRKILIAFNFDRKHDFTDDDLHVNLISWHEQY